MARRYPYITVADIEFKDPNGDWVKCEVDPAEAFIDDFAETIDFSATGKVKIQSSPIDSAGITFTIKPLFLNPSVIFARI